MLTKDEKVVQSFSFEMRFGRGLNLVFPCGCEIRIGCTIPHQWEVVITNKGGAFPIRSLLGQNGITQHFSYMVGAEEAAHRVYKQIMDKFGDLPVTLRPKE